MADNTGSAGKGTGRGVLEGAFLLLEELARSGEMRLTQLADAAGLPKATAHRLLAQLLIQGAVERRAGRYRIGPQMFRLGHAWQPAPALRTAARRPLRELVAATPRASLSVASPDVGGVLVVGGILGEVDEIFPLRAGVVLPPASAAYVAMAIATPDAPPPDGYSTAEWRRQLTGARDRGVAFHYEDFLACLAAPVRAPSGTIVAAVGAAVLDGRRLPEMSAAVQRTADRVSANLARLRHGRW